jgi:hypothetical protein
MPTNRPTAPAEVRLWLSNPQSLDAIQDHADAVVADLDSEFDL